MLEQGEVEERQRQCVVHRRQSPFPIPLCRVGAGGREVKSEVEPGKNGGVGKVFLDLFFFLVTLLILTGNKSK